MTLPQQLNADKSATDPAGLDHRQRTLDGAANLAAALELRNRFGLSVLALCTPDHVGVGKEHAKKCQSPGKVPWYPWKEFQDRPATEREIRDWWRYMPTANLGFALGPVSGSSGTIRIDIEGASGEARLQELSRGDLPATLEFTSGRASGGRGLLYAIPPGVELRSTHESPKPNEELRFQAKGALTVLPPSRHVSGNLYAWKHAPGEIELATCPAWLVEQLAVRADRNGTHHNNGKSSEDWRRIYAGVQEGERNSSATALAGKIFAATRDLNSPSDLATAFELFALWNTNNDPPLDQSELQSTWLSILRAEKAKRQQHEAQALNDYADAQPSTATPSANGHHDTTSAPQTPKPSPSVEESEATTPEAETPKAEPPEARSTRSARVEIPIVRTASAIKPQAVSWLWRKWIPKGATTLLDGNPGLGKSTLALDIAARHSRGWQMPPASGPREGAEPEGVLLLSAEDDPANTIRPRLDEAGADVSRIHIFEAMKSEDSERPPILPWDLDMMETIINARNIGLVIVDPFMAFLDGEINSHKDQDVRLAMHRLKLLAAKTGAAILIIRHLNKMNHAVAIYRGGGSIGIVGASRSAMLVGHHPDKKDTLVLASNKSNLGPRPRSLCYTLEPAGDVAKIGWGEETDLTADEIVAACAQQKSAADKCAAELAAILANEKKSPYYVTDVEAELARLGYSERAIKGARKKLKVRSVKETFSGKRVFKMPDAEGEHEGEHSPCNTQETDPFE